MLADTSPEYSGQLYTAATKDNYLVCRVTKDSRFSSGVHLLKNVGTNLVKLADTKVNQWLQECHCGDDCTCITLNKKCISEDCPASETEAISTVEPIGTVFDCPTCRRGR